MLLSIEKKINMAFLKDKNNTMVKYPRDLLGMVEVCTQVILCGRGETNLGHNHKLTVPPHHYFQSVSWHPVYGNEQHRYVSCIPT